MKLSFVIPAYNEEHYLGDCLKAIFAQKQGLPYEIEIVVVNNASTDRTKEVAKSYPGVVVVDEKEKGIVRARLAGLLVSTGDLIANVDADTRLTPGWIKKAMEAFAKDKKLVALSGPFIYYDAPRKVQIFTRLYWCLAFPVYLLNRFVLRVGSMLQGGNYVVRRSAIEAIGGYNTDIDFYGEDVDIARRLNKIGKVRFTFKLPMYSSGRRLAKEGGLTMAFRYPLNYFWVIFFKRPFTKTSTDIRFESKEAITYESKNELREWMIGAGALLVLLAIIGSVGYLIYRYAH
jgi:glycosyltransferase involved in cell wall biosynthesis